jgi:hypothetical protein
LISIAALFSDVALAFISVCLNQVSRNFICFTSSII